MIVSDELMYKKTNGIHTQQECLTALGKSWHPGHFFCRECGDPFEEDGYMVHDDFPYCEKDYLRLFAPKCTGCQDPIQGDFISALKGKWHRDCFGCTVSGIFLLCFPCVCEIALCRCEFLARAPLEVVLISRTFIFCLVYFFQVCHIGFDNTSYYVENGKPYCQAHYKSGAASVATQSA